MRVIKLGGNDLRRPGFLLALARGIVTLRQPPVLVHGGGREVDELMGRLGLTPVKVDGLRRTDRESLEAVLMVLCGSVRSRLVASLVGAGVEAIGLSGVDAGLIRCRPLGHPGIDLGLVGEVVSVRSEILDALRARHLTPVLSPVCLGLDGQIYNVNADSVATAIALALGAERLEFVSDVPGVRDGATALHSLPLDRIEGLITSGTVKGGMVTKVRAAAAAVRAGVPVVRIIGLESLQAQGGTTVIDPRRPAAVQGAPR